MDILKSLTQISTDYSFFEKDQVLSHDQLNSITGYLDDQTRLTRVNLIGVGIACGLNISLQNNVVKVSKGVGVTTDGDLIYFSSDSLFEKFKPYDESNPKYEPFYVRGNMIMVYELVQKGVADERAVALSRFNAQTGKNLNNMLAVLFMESFEKDDDLCSGTDCDNLGKDRVNKQKLLLVEKQSAELLSRTFSTPHHATSKPKKLDGIVADRLLISPSTTTVNKLNIGYRAVCKNIHGKLIAELPKLYPNCAAFLADILSTDPSTAWVTGLNNLQSHFSSDSSGIQYYYDFLKDVAETYNRFRELLFGDMTWCCPDIESFPKHLLLGNLVSGAGTLENRTAFYHSPAVSRSAEQLNHARFLVRKLDTLIRTFDKNKLKLSGSAETTVRITPSMFEDRPLEERAIPYYYRVDAKHPIERSWNYYLHQRGMDTFNYSYNAAAYGAEGGAARPHTSQTGCFSFFRIEGHLGKNVDSVVPVIENEIRNNNLPFAVQSVMLGTDKRKVVKKPGIRYTDLHRLHYVLRQDLSHQLNDVVHFSGKFREKVNAAVAANIVTNSPDDNDGAAVLDIATEKNSTVKVKAESARPKLNMSYSLYRSDISWKDDVKDVMKAAGEFKYSLGKVVKTDFSTAFDSFIGSTHMRWLDWLDDIFKRKEEQEDERLLFPNFIKQHPGVEHFAGVQRGGTFIVVYDENKKVVADFMLPYYCCDTVEEEQEEPPLKKPYLWSDWILENGLKVLSSRDKYLKDKLDYFKNNVVDGFIKDRIDAFKLDHLDVLRDNIFERLDFQQKEYLTGFRDSLSLMGNALIGVAASGSEFQKTGKYTDTRLNEMVRVVNECESVIKYLSTKAGQSGLTSGQKKAYEEQIKVAEAEMISAIDNTAKYVDKSGTDVSLGTEGMAAMMELSKGVESIKLSDNLQRVNMNLTNLKNRTENPGLKILLGNMVRER